MTKPRSDSILLNLPEEQQAKLAEWLLGGMPYHEARLLVEKEFAAKVRSLSAFTDFWVQVCQPALIARRARAVGSASARALEADRNPADFDRATLDALKQKAYELSENPRAAARDVKAVLGLLLKARDQDLEARRVSLLEEKAKRADAAESIAASGLSPEETAARIREIFRRQ